MSDQVKVLYITGWGRSGSTILGNILGEIDCFSHVGEVRSLWDNLIKNKLCGSGKPLMDSALWRNVLNEAFDGMERIDAHEMISLRESVSRTRHIPLMLIPGATTLLTPRLEQYLDVLTKLYVAIRACTASKVVVDSSKMPSYGYLLGMIPIIDLYIVHLIRDPRATAYSWLRKKPSLDTSNETYLPQYSCTKTALLWSIFNLTAEAFWGRSRERYIMLRYEDFVEKPQEAVKRILDLLEEPNRLPFVGEREVELGVNHTIAGNPDRFQRGKVELRSDTEWEDKMRHLDKTIVTALTWPLLLRYEYIGRKAL
jgi:hypothetical protein